MNYRHAFHAGNFADVFKHALLARILAYLAAKEAPFRYHDTHAGFGLYDLTGDAPGRTGEAAEGVGRFLAAPREGAMEALFKPYVAALRAFNALDGRFYPGSPLVAAHLLRLQDRLSLAELQPDDGRALRRRFERDRRVGVILGDGYGALNAWLPPHERRGMTLIDPPFEQPDEFSRLLEAAALSHRKWPPGILAIWYPIKSWREPDRFHRALRALAIPKTLRLELVLDTEGPDSALNGCGLIVVNPPWTLKDEAAAMLPFLARALARGSRTSWRADWLVGE